MATANNNRGVEIVTSPVGDEYVRSRFYFFVASPPVTGGDLVTIAHAKALIKAGVDARFLYHPNKTLGRSIADFPPDVPVDLIAERNVQLVPSDFLIIGESQGPLYRDLKHWIAEDVDIRTIPKVVMFNQAVHWMPYAWPSAEDFNQRRMAGTLLASQFIYDHMQQKFGMDVAKVFKFARVVAPITQIPEHILELPDSLSRSEQLENKPKCKIAYIFNSRKRMVETSFLDFAFQSMYPEYASKVEFVRIDRCQHEQVLTYMRNADIFIASGYMDSHNLPACEAMAAGCHVVGYTGLSLPVPHFNPDNGWWFNHEGAIREQCEILARAVDLYYATDELSKQKRRTLIENGQNMVKANFSPDSANTQIVAAYQELFEQVLGYSTGALFKLPANYKHAKFV